MSNETVEFVEVNEGDQSEDLENVLGSKSTLGIRSDLVYTSFGGTKAGYAQVTTDAYVDVKAGSALTDKTLAFALEGKQRGTIAVKNGGANAIHFRVLGSLDGGKTFGPVVSTDPVAVPAGSTIGFNWANTGAAGAAFGVYTHLKVQVKSAVAATPGNAAVQGAFTT